MRVFRDMRRYPEITVAIVLLAAVLALRTGGEGSAARWVATAFVGAFIVWTLVGMVRDVLRGHVGLDVLAVVAMVATLAVREYVAALIIVLMLSGGRALEDFAARRAKRDLTALLDRSPRVAHVLRHPDTPRTDELLDVPVEDVAIGDVLLVRPGEIVPVDGVLLTDSGTFDESSLTGESLPVTRAAGEEALSGAVNGTRVVRIRAVRLSADSQYQQIVALVRTAEDSRAPVVRLADRFAVPFTAVSLVLAGAAWTISGDPTRFAEVLVLATPCPLLIAAPVAFLGGLSRAARSGVIVKSGTVIEQLARLRSAAFDKTGTLTQGRPDLRFHLVAHVVGGVLKQWRTARNMETTRRARCHSRSTSRCTHPRERAHSGHRQCIPSHSDVLPLLNRIQLVRLLWRNGRLAWRLLRDPRTPLLPKVILGAAIVYAFSPLGLVPDIIPVLGQMDDLAVLGLGIEVFFKNVPGWLRAEHEAALNAERPTVGSPRL
jgi:cation transport ATPase/uncharacterized membrane protein YkvA (DUF1232 family)